MTIQPPIHGYIARISWLYSLTIQPIQSMTIQPVQPMTIQPRIHGYIAVKLYSHLLPNEEFLIRLLLNNCFILHRHLCKCYCATTQFAIMCCFPFMVINRCKYSFSCQTLLGFILKESSSLFVGQMKLSTMVFRLHKYTGKYFAHRLQYYMNLSKHAKVSYLISG